MMKKLSIGLLVALIAVSFALTGCPTDAEPNTAGFTVTFDRNYVEGNPAVVKVHVPADGTVGLNLPAIGSVTITNPERPIVSQIEIPVGRQFKEWNYRADGKGKTFTSLTAIDQDLTIYAIWEPKYNLSANLITRYSLLYNDQGGKDDEGIYNYQVTFPLSGVGISPKPGTIGAGKSLKLDLDGIPCYDLDEIQFKLVDVSGAAIQTISNAEIKKTGLIQKQNFFVGTDVNNDNVVDPGTGENLTLSVAVPNHSPDVHLLISANMPILTDKLDVYAHINLTPAADAVTLAPSYEVDLLKSGSTFSWRFSNILYRADTTISPSLVDDTVEVRWPAPSPYDPPGYDMTLRRAGFQFPGIVDVNSYSKVEIEYTAHDGSLPAGPGWYTTDFKFGFLSNLIQEVESAGLAPSATFFQNEIPATPGVKTTANIPLPGNLPVIRTFALWRDVQGSVVIHKITFKN